MMYPTNEITNPVSEAIQVLWAPSSAPSDPPAVMNFSPEKRKPIIDRMKTKAKAKFANSVSKLLFMKGMALLFSAGTFSFSDSTNLANV